MTKVLNDNQWKLFFKIGAISVFLAFLTMLTEIFLTALPDGARVELSVVQLFDMYNRNWFMAMRYMGLMNIISNTLMLLVSFALFGLYYRKFYVFTFLTLIVSLVGYAIFISDNASFAFLELARKYSETNVEIDKRILISAGEALFAKGASHTPGTFIGLLLGEIANIFFSILILKGKIFKKIVGIIGIISFTFLMIFEIISSLIASLYEEAMIFAMIGGLLTLVWYILVGLGLLKQSEINSTFNE